jgi:predicted nucleic acid-binding protein
MTYVLDSCVGIKWLIPEVDSASALRVRTDFVAGRLNLIVPDIYPVEVAHSLTRAERRGRITLAQGLAHFQDVMATLPPLYPHIPHLPRAYDLASQFRIGVYDCLYVALAEREGCELVTADDKLVRTLGPQFPFVLPLASLP